MTKSPRFKGYIHDVGGPTANFRQPACKKQLKTGVCKDRQCLYPKCRNLEVSHRDYLALLRKLRSLEGVKKVFVRSGLRYDYMMYDSDHAFFRELVQHHISGQLKVAPEHISTRVLQCMGKPDRELYDRFVQRYYAINRNLGKNQYLVPYFMSSHPGCDLDAAIELACYLKENDLRPEQVQDFYPTPGTLSTAMFYTGLDPRTMQPVFVEKNPQGKAVQRALMQYYRKENAPVIRKALIRAGREDLIGYAQHCLVRPEHQPAPGKKPSSSTKNRGGKPASGTSRRRKTSLSKHLNKKKKK